MTLSGNTLYGTTERPRLLAAPSGGTVFSVPVSGGTANVLASFNRPTPVPYAGLTLSGNTLYGTSP